MFIFSSLWHQKNLQMGTDRSGDLLMCRFCGSSNKMEISPPNGQVHVEVDLALVLGGGSLAKSYRNYFIAKQ
jgi:hypothetical protein